MNFTINDVDQVIERTGCSYEEAKDALIETDGDVIDAIILLQDQKKGSSFFRDIREETDRTAESIAEKMRDAIKAGNVNRIEVRDPNGKRVASVKVNTGAAIGGIALLAGGAPLMIVSGLVAKYGLKYDFVVVKGDDSETYL